ncbi:hypothetical protein QQS21_001387 [Conoideocrella luteorostrata]|uniref:Vacuolar calcium ion transporter n=1 Tax=Conoideocrella luteorostrata TaxID=1105319 RepID=A0AAJ0G1X9_9HYPO|nr:hypothetical protein QQS21_001387 [Conoideocrella luteorostrata]
MEAGNRQSQQASLAARLPTLFSVNLFLVFVPLGLVAHAKSWPVAVVALLNLVAIVPLSVHLSSASDAIGNRWGSLIGGLVNASFGNTVELIVGIVAVLRDEPRVAQSIMLGSILSDILLVQGFCFIAAARGTGVLQVNSAIADTLSTLMIITTVALVLPAALYSTFSSRKSNGADVGRMVLSFSRATAIVLLVVYAAYLYFQLKTHSSIFVGEDDEEAEGEEGDWGTYRDDPRGDAPEAEMQAGGDDTPSLAKVAVAGIILLASGAIIAKCTVNLMEHLDGMSQSLNISKTFIAIVIIPLVSNAPEMAQVVAASRKQKINFAIGVIIGSILQIALFVLPVLVLIGWVWQRRMDLYFQPSQTYILLLAAVLVNQVLQDKHYTFLHGVLLISVYVKS